MKKQNVWLVSFSLLLALSFAVFTACPGESTDEPEPTMEFTKAPVLTLSPDNTQIKYNWTDSDPAADTYDVYWAKGSIKDLDAIKAGTKISKASAGNSISSLTNGEYYTVVVAANKKGYKSIYSDPKSTQPRRPEIKILYGTYEGGVLGGPEEALPGQKVEIYVLENTNWEFVDGSLKVNEGEIPVTRVSRLEYTFNMPSMGQPIISAFFLQSQGTLPAFTGRKVFDHFTFDGQEFAGANAFPDSPLNGWGTGGNPTWGDNRVPLYGYWYGMGAQTAEAAKLNGGQNGAHRIVMWYGAGINNGWGRTIKEPTAGYPTSGTGTTDRTDLETEEKPIDGTGYQGISFYAHEETAGAVGTIWGFSISNGEGESVELLFKISEANTWTQFLLKFPADFNASSIGSYLVRVAQDLGEGTPGGAFSISRIDLVQF